MREIKYICLMVLFLPLVMYCPDLPVLPLTTIVLGNVVRDWWSLRTWWKNLRQVNIKKALGILVTCEKRFRQV